MRSTTYMGAIFLNYRSFIAEHELSHVLLLPPFYKHLFVLRWRNAMCALSMCECHCMVSGVDGII